MAAKKKAKRVGGARLRGKARGDVPKLALDVREGDCLEIMRELPDACFDSVVTDPPYALEFMGQGWDKVLPSAEVWAECLRLAKPGAMMFVFGGTRTYHRLTCAIEDAGWEIRDCLSWMYGQGFPKSMDIGKAIDKAAGATREVTGVNPTFRPNTTNNERGLRDRRVHGLLTAPSTDAAKQWDGWGTALKPAWEPIVLAMKPLDGTFASNAIQHGVAGLNIDGCRVGLGHNNGHGRDGEESAEDQYRDYGSTSFTGKPGPRGGGPNGRFPANVVLDEIASMMLDEHTGELRSGTMLAGTKRAAQDEPGSVCYGTYGGNVSQRDLLANSGGASRFFYTAKATRAERTANGRVRNNHPTVKPLELIRWIVRLTKTPTGGTVFDPFVGSGTTPVACAREWRHCLGIDKWAEAVRIARRRLEYERFIAVAEPWAA